MKMVLFPCRLYGTLVLFYLHTLFLIVSSLSSPHSNRNGNTDRSSVVPTEVNPPRQEQEQEQHRRQRRRQGDRNHRGFSIEGAHLEYSTTPVRDEEAQQHQQKQLLPPPPPPPLVLTRRDGIDLYGRKIVHSDCDVRTATLSFLNATTTTTTKSPLPLLLLFEFDGQPSIWDATLVLRPDRNHQQQQRPSDQAKGPNAKKNTNNNICCCEDDDDERESPSMLLPLPLLLSTADWTSPFCFVAMNRFQVKEECKFLFEERWSQRQSKLSHQPGFLGFSLLRKSAAGAQSTQQQQQQQQQQDQHHRGTTIAKEEALDDEREHDRFNYSTCTVWDSIESWERWRNGVGKTSHEASKGDRGKQRVPVSEWLEGPSSPIFWDGQQSIEGVMDGTGQPNA